MFIICISELAQASRGKGYPPPPHVEMYVLKGGTMLWFTKKIEKAEVLAWNQQHIVYLTESYRGVIYFYLFIYLLFACQF